MNERPSAFWKQLPKRAAGEGRIAGRFQIERNWPAAPEHER